MSQRKFNARIQFEWKEESKGLSGMGTVRGSWWLKQPLKEQVEERVKGSVHPDVELVSFKIIKPVMHEECPECGSVPEAYTTNISDNTFFDGDDVICPECNNKGAIAVYESYATIEWA